MLNFRVYGVPAPQGSKNARVGKDGRAHMYEQSAKTLKPWREEISDVGAKVMDGRDPLDGPLFAEITFFMKRPAKPKFTDFPAVKPDADKLTRGVFDALKMANVIKDDARIVKYFVDKVFADTPDDQGALITVMTMDEWLGLAR
jgi:crossover junction endodeoxyribonuclease RusA